MRNLAAIALISCPIVKYLVDFSCELYYFILTFGNTRFRGLAAGNGNFLLREEHPCHQRGALHLKREGKNKHY
jgi:hypothetical protein